jgi:pyruvate,water dikinase
MAIHTEHQLTLNLAAPAATLELVGGKGASLARMAAAGLPVPGGFHITTTAYDQFVERHALQPRILEAIAPTRTNDVAALGAAAQTIEALFLRSPIPSEIADPIVSAYAALGHDLPVAVRSSATAEDLPDHSFAGQQESFLNVQGQEAVLEAVRKCWASLWSARAIGYRNQNGIAHEHISLAVVVQELIPAEAAGIMFTANPLSGEHTQMVINAAWGLGEAIVGGQVTPDTVVVATASGTIVEQQIGVKEVMTVRVGGGTAEQPVPGDRRSAPVLDAAQIRELCALGARIQALYGAPMDVEWALAGGHFAIVQARPITTLAQRQPAPEEWNDSLKGNYLWTIGNVGEAVPDVMTPATWSLVQIFIADAMGISEVGGHHLIGNIGGRFYMNVSLLATLAHAFGLGPKRFNDANEQAFGRIPESMKPPLVALGRWQIMREMLPQVVALRRRVAANQKRLPGFLATAPARCEAQRLQIEAASSPAELIELWHAELLPFFRECSRMLEAAARRDGSVIVWVRRELHKLVDEADANALLSGLHGNGGQLASLGPLLGLAQLARGTIDRATFARQWGHRSPHEFEVSIARPAEQPGWIDAQLAGLRDAPVDVDGLLERQAQAQAAAWARFERRYPAKVARIRKRIAQAAEAFRLREGARSEVVRVFWPLRALLLRAGQLTGLGSDIFFLRIEEVLALLGGDRAALAHIPARRAAFQRYQALPPYPALIRGRFDPQHWAADPHRRTDLYDAGGQAAPASATVSGFPGAAGVVEGYAHVIATPEQGDQLRAGEILVTTVTNVGWTPLFPRAAAVVTDVGAPLSHAAIVARELGIPAVVGCGNATMRIRTGDLLRVDGGQGTVEVVQAATS